MYKIAIEYHEYDRGNLITEVQIAPSFKYFYVDGWRLAIEMNDKLYCNVAEIRVDGELVERNFRYKDEYGDHGIIEITNLKRIRRIK